MPGPLETRRQTLGQSDGCWTGAEQRHASVQLGPGLAACTNMACTDGGIAYSGRNACYRVTCSGS